MTSVTTTNRYHDPSGRSEGVAYHPVFVYGTLRSGQPNHRLFGDGVIELITTARLDGAVMFGLGRGFPYVIDGDGVVTGELVTVSSASFHRVMSTLDALEGYRGPGYDNHYDRVLRTVTADNATVTAWMYLATPRCSLGEPVPSGDWVNAHIS